jgi:hypothetical protein
LGMGRLGHRPARQGLGDSSSHLSSQPPARAHDWHRVFSHGAFLGRAVCRRHLQATGPSVFPVVPSRACSGDVQFRWATERLPIVGCHMCRRQFVGTPRLGTEVASCYIRLVGRASCTSALNLIAGFSPPGHLCPRLCLQLVVSFMGIMHLGQMVGMASLGTEPRVRACPGFSVGQASRSTGEILGPWDATQAGGWHSHLGRRVLSQAPVP